MQFSPVVVTEISPPSDLKEGGKWDWLTTSE